MTVGFLRLMLIPLLPDLPLAFYTAMAWLSALTLFALAVDEDAVRRVP
jgi:hypothetical protein